MKKKIVVPLIMALFTGLTLSLSACNTVHGAGKDVKSVGNAVEDTADDMRPKN